MAQVQIPNLDHCYDELVFISFVSQGLTLLTASLVVKPKSKVQSPEVKTKRTCADTKITFDLLVLHVPVLS